MGPSPQRGVSTLSHLKKVLWQICYFWLAAFQRTDALKNPGSAVFSFPTHFFFNFLIFFKSETSGLSLETLQDKLSALCTTLVLSRVYEGIIMNELTDSTYLAFLGWAHLCPRLEHSTGYRML